VNSPPPKPEVILTNFFAEPTVLLVPITSRVKTKMKVNLGTRCSLKMSKNMNKRATENYILKFLIVASVSSDNIVKGM
jgi:hypothetical protein